MASLFTAGKFQALSTAGLALPGALVYTYAAGTLTPLASYTDQGGLSSNANPVVCDVAGQASVWLGSAAYRVILKTAAGATVWDVDNISGAVTTADLGSSTVSLGDALILVKRTAAGSVACTLHDWVERQTFSVFEFMTSAEIANVIAGTNSIDVTTAINTANTAVAAKFAGGVLKFPAGVYRTTAEISIPNKVSWVGETYGQTNNAGTTWDVGPVIYKAHTGDAVSMKLSNNAGQIKDMAVWSDKATWATGRGFVVGPAAGCHLIDCTVRTVGGDAFVIGDGTINSYTNCLTNCYSNNPGGRNFVVNGHYFRGTRLISDGGTIGIEFEAARGAHWSLHGDCHFEGFTVNAMRIEADAGVAAGRVQTVTYAGVFLTHVLIPSSASITNIMLRDLDLGSASAGAGSIGVDIGALCTGVSVHDSYIGLFETGIRDSGNDDHIDNTKFVGCVLPINADGDLYTYTRNTTRGTTGLYSIAHNSGTRGLWAQNKLDVTINAAVTGVPGDFSGIRVRDNQGYVSRNSGTTASIATGTAITHGLAGVPSPDIVMTTTTAGVTSSPQRTASSSTTFTFGWAGTSPAVWSWNAHLPCDY
jgi:hypothetical protein